MIESVAFMVMAAAGPKDIPDSPYRGYHYEEKWEPVRKCIFWRESSGRYKADGPYGSGIAQWIQSTWDVYADRAGYPEYVGVRPFKVPSYVQEDVFWFMINPFPKKPALHGYHHWEAAHALTIGKKIGECYE